MSSLPSGEHTLRSVRSRHSVPSAAAQFAPCTAADPRRGTQLLQGRTQALTCTSTDGGHPLGGTDLESSQQYQGETVNAIWKMSKPRLRAAEALGQDRPARLRRGSSPWGRHA